MRSFQRSAMTIRSGICAVAAMLVIFFTFMAMLPARWWKAPHVAFRASAEISPVRGTVSLGNAGPLSFRNPESRGTSLSDILSAMRNRDLHDSVTFSDGPIIIRLKPSQTATLSPPRRTITPASAISFISRSPGASPSPISDHDIEATLPEKGTRRAPTSTLSAAVVNITQTTNSPERGVVLFALSSSSHDNVKKLASAVATLSSARANSRQGWIRAHLFTTLDLPSADRASWDAITFVPFPSPGVSPDLYALSLLPNSSFRYSLVLPPGNTVCGDVHDMLDVLVAEEWHVLITSGAAAFGGSMSLGIMGWSQGPEFRALHTSWLEIARKDSRSGTTSMIDFVVQHPSAASYRIGVVARPAEIRYSRASPGSVMMSSALIAGAVLAYPTATSTTAAMRGLCSWAAAPFSSSGSRRDRVFVFNSSTGAVTIMSSTESICAALGNRRCTDAWITGAAFSGDNDSNNSITAPLLHAYRPPTPSPSPAPLAQRRIHGLTYGVVMFGYSLDQRKSAEYTVENAITARGIKHSNPGVPVALITNARNLTAEFPWDLIIPMSDNDVLRGRQMWSRTLYLNHTPFDLTITVDSGRGVCGGLMDLFEILARGWDMVGTSGGSAGAPIGQYDNGVLGYKLSPAFNAVQATWLSIYAKFGKLADENGDDQHPLARALRLHPTFRAAIVPPRFHAVYGPAQRLNEGRSRGMRHSLVLDGPVVVSPGVGPTEADRIRLCTWLNSDTRPRVVVFNATTPGESSVKHAFSPVECDKLTGGRCNHPELNWTLPQSLAVPFLYYVDTH